MRRDEREVSQGQIINDFTGQIEELSSFPEDYGEPLKCSQQSRDRSTCPLER